MDGPGVCNAGALRQAARRVSKLYDAALAPAGVGINQFSILTTLRLAGPSSINDLARQLVMDRSTLGRLLRPLEARRLVRLGVSETDRRSRVVALTRSGQALIAEAAPLWADAQRRFESAFGKAASGDLRKTLKRVVATDFA